MKKHWFRQIKWVEWLKPKLTFMIIPEANNSVLRFRMSYVLLVAIPVIMITFACLAVFFYKTSSNNASTIVTLQHQIHGQSQQMQQAVAERENTISDKNRTIEQLQNQVIELSSQANAIKDKMSALEKLGSDMGINIENIDASDNTVTADNSDTKPHIVAIAEYSDSGLNEQAVGGELIPATDEDILQLSGTTQSDYITLDQKIDSMMDSLKEAKKAKDAHQHQLDITPSIWPIGSRTITSYFGYRKDPFTGHPSFHSGYDIATKTDTPVHATAEGKIRTTGYDSSHGNYIVIDHGNGIQTWYLHLHKILVKRGQTVKKGEKIALSGSTGRSTGPHLHYEVHKNGVIVNPGKYLP